MSELHPKLPGPVATVIELIAAAEEDTLFNTLPNKCAAILRCSEGERVDLNHVDLNGNVISSHGFVFLHKEKKNPTEEEDFMQVVLRVEQSNAVTLIIRKDNLYLIGFFSNRGYFELESENENRLLPHARLLNINVNYQTLLNIDMKADGKKHISTKFGLPQLIAAVIALDNKTTSENELKRHLAVVIIMIIESTRFTNIMRSITGAENMTLAQLVEQIKTWDDGSKALWNYRNALEGGSDVKSTPVPVFRTVYHAALKMKAIHHTQERKLGVTATSRVSKSKWKSPLSKQSKGESSSSSRKSKNRK